MLDIYEKDYVKDVKKKLDEQEVKTPEKPEKPDNTDEIKNLQRQIDGLQKRKEAEDDATQIAKIAKQMADIRLKMAYLRK